jgi:hypothetical protein
MNLATIESRLMRSWPHGWLLAGAVAASLAGCGGSGGGGGETRSGAPTATGCDPSASSAASECSTLLVGLTDAEGDIISYSVDVEALSLERADGDVVEILPATTRIDFAQLTDLTELVSAVFLPPGNYVGGTIRIDYSAAEIFVEAGGDIVTAEPVDDAGGALGSVNLRIDLPEDDQLVMTRGRAAFLSIDFDLAASHDVDTTVSPPRIMTEPFITAELEPADDKELRVRGALVEVDLADQSYDIRVRPWHRRSGDHGPVTVHTTDTTNFEFGDQVLVGAAGLAELATLGEGALTAAFGTLNLSDRSFTAELVLARDGVEGDRLDAVHGNIVARSEDLLTVRGAFGVHRGDRARFHRTVFVQLGPETSVFKVSDRDGDYDKDDLSIGQRIVAFGQFDEATLAPDIAPILDATNARVRMHPTHVSGEVVDIITGQVTLNLRGIDRLGIDHFDFSGTGISEDLDANPESYEVATSSLMLDSLTVGRPARIAGFPTRFGTAPPNFTANSLVSHDHMRAVLGLGWVAPGTNAPFLSMGADGLVPDLSNEDIGGRHHMKIGREIIDLFDLSAAPTISPTEFRGLYSLHEPGHVELFRDFSEFVEELSLRISNSDTVRSIAAYGTWDEDASDLDARKAVVFTLPAATE